MCASTRIYTDGDEDLSCHAVWSVLHSFPNLQNNFLFALGGDKLVLNTAREVSRIKQMSAYTQFFLIFKKKLRKKYRYSSIHLSVWSQKQLVHTNKHKINFSMANLFLQNSKSQVFYRSRYHWTFIFFLGNNPFYSKVYVQHSVLYRNVLIKLYIRRVAGGWQTIAYFFQYHHRGTHNI